MKNAHIRILILLAITTVVGTIGTQLYWIQLAIDQQDQAFNHNVHVALRNVVESLCEANGKDYPSTDPIEQVSPSYFIVRTNDQININDLEYLITAEIKKRSITQYFDYGVYNCQNDQMVFAKNVSLQEQTSARLLPNLENEDYYFGVFFPNKSRNLIAELDIWKFTSALTLIVLIFFGYALFVILRQKRLSEIQKDFINNITHELKTPLATLALASESIKGKPVEKQDEYLRIIQNEIQKLQQSVSDILHASMIESRQKASKEALDIESFIRSLTADLKIQYAARMLTWNVTCDAKENILSDKKTLETAIKNLVDNAVKYGGDRISILVKQDATETSISISDNGDGIEEKYFGLLFSKFYRVPEVANRHHVSGFGLGLYLTKKALKRVNGKIRVTSVKGSGSTFTINLPNG